MSAIPKPTKEQLLKAIGDLEKNPDDRVSILGKCGITAFGALGGGTIVTTMGTTSLFSLFGYSLLTISPAGWMIAGGAVLGGAALYGASKLVGSGGLAEGRKLELLKQYREEAKKMEAKERVDSITDKDRSAFIIMLKEVIEKGAISPDEASQLIERVEKGRITLSQAFESLNAFVAK